MDDLLITIIIAGIALSIAYLRAEFASHRGRKVKERKKAIVQRELPANRLKTWAETCIANGLTKPSGFP